MGKITHIPSLGEIASYFESLGPLSDVRPYRKMYPLRGSEGQASLVQDNEGYHFEIPQGRLSFAHLPQLHRHVKRLSEHWPSIPQDQIRELNNPSMPTDHATRVANAAHILGMDGLWGAIEKSLEDPIELMTYFGLEWRLVSNLAGFYPVRESLSPILEVIERARDWYFEESFQSLHDQWIEEGGRWLIPDDHEAPTTRQEALIDVLFNMVDAHPVMSGPHFASHNILGTIDMRVLNEGGLEPLRGNLGQALFISALQVFLGGPLLTSADIMQSMMVLGVDLAAQDWTPLPVDWRRVLFAHRMRNEMLISNWFQDRRGHSLAAETFTFGNLDKARSLFKMIYPAEQRKHFTWIQDANISEGKNWHVTEEQLQQDYLRLGFNGELPYPAETVNFLVNEPLDVQVYLPINDLTSGVASSILKGQRSNVIPLASHPAFAGHVVNRGMHHAEAKEGTVPLLSEHDGPLIAEIIKTGLKMAEEVLILVFGEGDWSNVLEQPEALAYLEEINQTILKQLERYKGPEGKLRMAQDYLKGRVEYVHLFKQLVLTEDEQALLEWPDENDEDVFVRYNGRHLKAVQEIDAMDLEHDSIKVTSAAHGTSMKEDDHPADFLRGFKELLKVVLDLDLDKDEFFIDEHESRIELWSETITNHKNLYQGEEGKQRLANDYLHGRLDLVEDFVYLIFGDDGESVFDWIPKIKSSYVYSNNENDLAQGSERGGNDRGDGIVLHPSLIEESGVAVQLRLVRDADDNDNSIHDVSGLDQVIHISPETTMLLRETMHILQTHDCTQSIVWLNNFLKSPTKNVFLKIKEYLENPHQLAAYLAQDKNEGYLLEAEHSLEYDRFSAFVRGPAGLMRQTFLFR